MAQEMPEGWTSYCPEYGAWKNMIHRCTNPKNAWWHRYGGRGIGVCDRWSDERRGFAYFLEDMGERPSRQHSLDRIDNERGYEPGNCRWATPVQQAEAKVRSGRNGPTMIFEGKTLREWAAEIGVGYDAFKIRYRKYRKSLITYEQLFEAPAVGRRRGLEARRGK